MFRAFATTLAGVPQGHSIEAAGDDLESAALIESDINRVTGGEGGLRLPKADGGVGCAVVNKTEASVSVYPTDMLGRINAEPLGGPFVVEGLTAAFFLCYEDGLWAVFAQGIKVTGQPQEEPEPVPEPEPEPVPEPA